MTTNSLQTNRLFIKSIQLSDADFIKALVNTDGWLQFIGDRNIKTKKSAALYLKKIIENPKVHYWVVYLKENQTPIGILTFIKRDYLEFYDFGFAFLPNHAKQGYAFEASAAMLSELIPGREKIQAVTLPENVHSIKLLEKLGFEQEGRIENESLLLYGYSLSEI